MGVTQSGKSCQKWTAQSPHKHDYTPDAHPGTGLGDHNFCRNPDEDTTIWCYTTEENTRWEFCAPLQSTAYEQIGGKKWKPATGCVTDWTYDGETISGYCTDKHHTKAWCSLSKEYHPLLWKDCEECQGDCDDPAPDLGGSLHSDDEHV